MKVIFSERAFTSLLAETYEKIKTETGGIFLGYYEDGVWYVVETIDPGPKSIFEVAYFEYDEKYVNHLINKIARIYKKNLTVVGLWHRHPGSFDVFSNTDDGTNLKYAKLAPQGAISALVNIDPNFRLTCYHVAVPLKYSRIQFEVNNALFPDNVLTLHSIESYIGFINDYNNPNNIRVRRNSKYSFCQIIDKVCKNIGEFDGMPYIKEIYNAIKKEGFFERISDIIYDDLDFLANELKIKLNFYKVEHYLCLSEDDTKIYFSYIESIDQYVFIYNNRCYLYKAGLIKDIISGEGKIEDKRGGFFGFLRRFKGEEKDD